MARRPRNLPLDTVGAILDVSGEQRFSPFHPPLSDFAWGELVGLTIARRTRPMALENGVLHLRCASSSWANELSFLEPRLIKKLKRTLPSVERLRFSVGTIEPPMRPFAKPPSPKPVPVPLSPSLTSEMEEIADPELREALKLVVEIGVGKFVRDS